MNKPIYTIVASFLSASLLIHPISDDQKRKTNDTNINNIDTIKNFQTNETRKTRVDEKQIDVEQLNNIKKEETTLTVTATAYTIESAGGSGITKTGINLNENPNAKVIAVDPNVIPLHSKVYVEGYGYAIAGDTGGAIKGNKIDLYVPSEKEAFDWGVRTVKVTILNS